VAIYAFPTTGCAVCVLLSESTHAATCIDSFDRRTGNVRWVMYAGVRAPPTLFGLASNAVTGVGVVVDGIAHDAVLRRNAFF
jgi:hypothetical protein